MTDIGFKTENLTAEESFWVMYYFLEEHYNLSDGQFVVSDILSASEPMAFDDKGHFDLTGTRQEFVAPADRAMISFWNDAIEKYRRNGRPGLKTLTK
ncbi:MAG: hypothetical protein ACXVPN_03875 [Bacteroidia bacterium]